MRTAALLRRRGLGRRAFDELALGVAATVRGDRRAGDHGDGGKSEGKAEHRRILPYEREETATVTIDGKSIWISPTPCYDQPMGALDHLQGDWWWSYVEEATAGERWRVEGDRIIHQGEALAWSEIPEGIRVEQPDNTFIVIEPSDDMAHAAHVYRAESGLEGFEEAGQLVPYADAEKEGWTKGHQLQSE